LEKILISMAAGLFFRFFFEPMILPEKRVQLQQSRGVFQKTEPSKLFSTAVEAPKSKTALPDYAAKVPKGHFVGISAPSKSMQTARMSAINNAMEQIVRAMGVTCSLNYRDRTYGSVIEIKREIDDDLKIGAEWFVKEVEQNIVRTDFITDDADVYTFFTLIRFSNEKIENMRRLTIGPKVSAKLVGMDGNVARIEALETNGVKVTFFEYEINAEKSYSRADFVSYYIWKVPKAKNTVLNGALKKPVVLNGDSCLVQVPIPLAKTKIGDYLLGASRMMRIVLIGYDEIGRRVVKRVDLSR